MTTKKKNTVPVKNKQCKGLTFDECELTILRTAVDKAEQIQGMKSATSDEIKKMVLIVEKFIRRSATQPIRAKGVVETIYNFMYGASRNGRRNACEQIGKTQRIKR